MKTLKLTKRPSSNSRGVTLVELLMGITIVAIALALTAPTMQETFARGDIRATAENISQAIRLAKNTARSIGQPVTLTISVATADNSISFTDVGGNAFVFKTSGVRLPTIQLPGKVSVAATQAAFRFDSMGKIVNFNQLTTIVLKSTVVSSQALTVSVVNELGYTTMVDGLVTSDTT